MTNSKSSASCNANVRVDYRLLDQLIDSRSMSRLTVGLTLQILCFYLFFHLKMMEIKFPNWPPKGNFNNRLELLLTNVDWFSLASCD
jgi:hypothetical protein